MNFLPIALGLLLVAIPGTAFVFLLVGPRVQGRRLNGKPMPKVVDVLSRSQWFLRTDGPFALWFGVYLLSSAWSVWNISRKELTWEVWVSVALVLLSSTSWVFRWRSKAAAADVVETVDNPDRFSVLTYLDPYLPSKGWETLRCADVDLSDKGDPLRGGELAVTNFELNRLLRTDKKIAIVRKGFWKPEDGPGDLRILTGGRHNNLNETKIRLASDLLPTSDSVILQDTDYASYVVTNNLALKEVLDKHGEVALNFPDVCLHAGALPPLAMSKCANHLGGDLLCIEPGLVRLQQQSAKAFVFANSWVATASGSFDADKDLKGADDLLTVVKKGLLREMDEEMGLDGKGLPGLEDTKVLGYARATYTAGKPQFYGVARSKRLGNIRKDLYTRRMRTVEFDPSGGIPAIVAEIRRLHEVGYRFSPALVLLLDALERWNAEDPEAFGWIRDGW